MVGRPTADMLRRRPDIPRYVVLYRQGRLPVFVIDDSSDSPVSIRLSTQRAAFDGRVMLSGARLLQHPA